MKTADVLKVIFLVIVVGSFAIAISFKTRPLVAMPLPTNVPCTVNVVSDFGADPSGATDSTGAFTSALNFTPGPNIVCVPPGTYSIGNPTTSGSTPAPHDITISGLTASGGGALVGPAQGVAVITQTDPTANIFDSCPITPSDVVTMPVPKVCATESAADVLQGWQFSNLTLTYPSSTLPNPTPGATSGPLNGLGPSAIYFPKISGVQFHNVVITNAWNCFDFGSMGASEIPSTSLVSILEGTALSQCQGHFFGLHGDASQVAIVRQNVSGLRTIGSNTNVFSGAMVDTSDVEGGTASSINFIENNWQAGAWGTVGFLADGSTFGFTTNGDLCSALTFACYYFFSRPGQSASTGSTSQTTIIDKRNTSWYAPLQFDGGSYASAGVSSIQINGGLYQAGVSPGTASSVFWITGSPAPGGFASDGSSITLQFPYGVPTPWSYTYTAGPGETPRTIAQHIAEAVGCSSLPHNCGLFAAPPAGVYPGEPMIGTTYMGNPYYAPIEMLLVSPPPQGTYTAQPYTVITTGALSVVNQQQSPFPTCALPTSIPTGSGTPTPFPMNTYAMTPAPCWTGYFDQGDAAVFKNNAHDVQVTSARLQSNGQASVHILNAGAYVHVVNSVLGSTDGAQTYDCLNVEPAAIPNLQITTNDCTGVAHLPIVYASPYPSPSPSFVPLLRNNRGAQGTVFTGSASISTASLTLSNQGPFDCTYYLDYNGAGTTTVTITYPDGVSQALPAGLVPISLFLPVGAGFSMAAVSGGSVSWTVFCLP